MGAWDTDSFGNDMVCDWTYGLEGIDDLSLVEQTIEQVLEVGSEYLESFEAEKAIAAAEVIARLLGNWGQRNVYSESVDAWVEAHELMPAPELVQKAQDAIDRLLTPPSELLELWQDSDELDSWKGSVLDLKARLTR